MPARAKRWPQQKQRISTNIDVPTLLVAGDEDPIAPVQVAREMARRIGDAQVESLSRCGHWMTAERAADCQSHLRRFLERSMART